VSLFSDAPAAGAEAVDISVADHTFANRNIRGLYVGGAGNVVVLLRNNAAAVTFTGVTAGTVLPIQPIKIIRTSTTATAMLGLY
jgi:hypothetical protein